MTANEHVVRSAFFFFQIIFLVKKLGVNCNEAVCI